MTSTALHCRDLIKAFGGVPVLKGVSLALAPGTVTALAGENGAGKSTLMKIASGQVRPDAGQVLVEGNTLHRADPREAHRLGVAIVPQELAPIRDMTVYENLFLGRELRTRAGLLDRRRMAAQARELLEVFDVDIDPKTPMRRLSVALCQIVEIVKSTSRGAARSPMHVDRDAKGVWAGQVRCGCANGADTPTLRPSHPTREHQT